MIRWGHGASCLEVDTDYTQLMITGGRGEQGVVYDDLWLLDITHMKWSKVR